MGSKNNTRIGFNSCFLVNKSENGLKEKEKL